MTQNSRGKTANKNKYRNATDDIIIDKDAKTFSINILPI